MNEDNILICKFMGVNPTDGDFFDGYSLHKAGLPFNYGAMGNGTRYLKFHESWDWLMPVIQKIINTIGVKTVDECSDFEWHVTTNVVRMYIGVDIKQAHHYVVEYIKWYYKSNQ